MKYCPNLVCPHRQRIHSPAEFLDHIVECSDCKTKLVDSEDAAIDGLEAPEGLTPYRAPGIKGERRIEPKRPKAKPNDVAIGWALILGGLALTGITYAAASGGAGGGRYMVVWGPIAYGAYRIMKGGGSESRKR